MSATESRKRKRISNRLGKCDVCRTTDAIYTCPRCEAVTCSLNCVKKHKKDLDCDGVRVRTKYVPVEKMNENNLLSDYRLLEDVRRCVEEAEWKRESLEQPQEAVADSTSENINRKVPDVEKPLESTEENNESNRSIKKNKAKRKPKKSSSLESKSDVLIAKANRIRKQILNKQTKAVKELNIEKTVDDPDDNQIKNSDNNEEKESRIETESRTGSSDEGPSAESTSISEETSEEEPEEIKFTAIDASEVSAEGPLVIPNDASDLSGEKQDIQSKCEKKHEPLSKEEFKKVRKAKLLEAVTLGGRKKAQTMEALANAAQWRGIALTCLPEKFEKHWENTSFFLPNEDCIYWHLKVSFINANFYTLSLNECAETMTLANMVKGCLRRSEEYWKNLGKDDPLLVYRTVDFSQISVLMAADNLPNSQRKFYVLDMSQTLRENFMGKCIVEFPQLCVALEDCHVVSSVQENLAHNFFSCTGMGSDEEEKEEEPKNEFEMFLKKRAAKKKTRQNTGRKVQRNVDECDRESGELTDSSSSSYSDTESSEDSEEELFKECDFRSIYKDLLTTFDTDVNQIHKNK